MNTLYQASRQWATRPADQRFLSLTGLYDFAKHQREISKAQVVSSRAIEAAPIEGDVAIGVGGEAFSPTHWSFGQLCNLAGAPASYLRTLPAEMVSDCLNWGMKFSRDVADVGVLTANNGSAELRAATGPNYGRIWNAQIAGALINRFGDGVTGDWRIPGEFGVQGKAITPENTTLYASDRDMWCFLADETNRVEIPNRRNGQRGSLARGFFVWNSEVGDCKLGAAFFLFDYMCGNHIVWGVEQFSKVSIRHTAGAPDRWLEKVVPVLNEYAHASAQPVVQAIEDARKQRIDDAAAFLQKRFTKSVAELAMAAHRAEEGRPIETVWDAVTGLTAYAKGIGNMDNRVQIEREAGKLLAA